MAFDSVVALDVRTNTQKRNNFAVNSRAIDMSRDCEGRCEEAEGVYYMNWQSGVGYATYMLADILTTAH
jgi:hypothetical protein